MSHLMTICHQPQEIEGVAKVEQEETSEATTDLEMEEPVIDVFVETQVPRFVLEEMVNALL